MSLVWLPITVFNSALSVLIYGEVFKNTCLIYKLSDQLSNNANKIKNVRDKVFEDKCSLPFLGPTRSDVGSALGTRLGEIFL